MKVIRFREEGQIRLAVWDEDDKLFVTSHDGFLPFVEQARKEGVSPAAYARQLAAALPADGRQVEELELVVPVEAPEVWAAGVTYERSRDARNYEATGGKLDATTFYDKVYDAQRPEIFFKATGARLMGPGDTLCLRSDSIWQVPEPELGLVLAADGEILGYTVGNDLSCRDIEGENPLYLPQAKVWRRSCSIGPAVRLAEQSFDASNLQIVSRILRNDEVVAEGSASTKQLKRTFKELVHYLGLDNDIYPGTVLLTGTCIVPPNDFTLQDGDRMEIEIEGIGKLVNPVRPAHAYLNQ